MNKAFIILGSNMGNKLAHLQLAIEQMDLRNISLIQQSSIYKTAAWGNTEQDDFYNQVIEVATELSAEFLLQTLLEIETKMGRTRNQKWEARIIDLDILYFNYDVIDTEKLKVPHPYLHVRRFTLIPLTEIAAHYIHPILKKTNFEMLVSCSDESLVVRN
ncbi:MAG: 2-amino-4-hydroxy-6-hydroxymethyldihydropteridine diphosphokinase [Bacteroidia bacterium]